MNVKLFRVTFLIFGSAGIISACYAEELLGGITWVWDDKNPKFDKGKDGDKIVANGHLYILVDEARTKDDLKDPKDAVLIVREYNTELGGWQSRTFTGTIGTKVWDDKKVGNIL